MPYSEQVNIDSPTRSSLNRRRFLQASLGLSTALALPASFAASKPADRILSLHNLHTGERVKATYWAEGQYQASELATLNHILRDHRTDEVVDMDIRLINLLTLLHEQVDGKQDFNIISGYRSPMTNAKLRQQSSGVAKKSFHMQAKAVDIALPGRDLKQLNKAALALQVGGVGYYPKSGFIHVDTGPVRHWG